jgi:hypothetical protein
MVMEPGLCFTLRAGQPRIRGSIPWTGRDILFQCPDRLRGSASMVSKGPHSEVVKQLGVGVVDLSTPSSTEVKIEWRYT